METDPFAAPNSAVDGVHAPKVSDLGPIVLRLAPGKRDKWVTEFFADHVRFESVATGNVHQLRRADFPKHASFLPIPGGSNLLSVNDVFEIRAWVRKSEVSVIREWLGPMIDSVQTRSLRTAQISTLVVAALASLLALGTGSVVWTLMATVIVVGLGASLAKPGRWFFLFEAFWATAFIVVTTSGFNLSKAPWMVLPGLLMSYGIYAPIRRFRFYGPRPARTQRY